MNKNIDKINHNTFRPIKSLKNKSNYKRFFTIEKDGSVYERVFLNVLDISLREEIIFHHYLSFLARNFVKNGVGVNIISRDNPWDFSLELSNGLSFNIEITSIADNKWLYEKMKREEEMEKVHLKKKIRLRELKKINLWFGCRESTLAIKESEKKNISPNDFIKNPLFGTKSTIYCSDSKDREKSLAVLVLKAIERKNNKGHKGKKETVLIIDNRTSMFEVADYQEAMKEIKGKLADVIFPEIYFYTGYYSDNDGNNSEYSFAPIKLSKKKYKQLKKTIKQRKLKMNKNGIVYD